MAETLILGDCLEKMKEIHDGSVDCVICDPPYYKIVDSGWDNQWEEMEHYIDFIRSAVLECKRVLKPNGSLYVFGDDKVIAYIQIELDKHLTLLNSLVWFKTNNQSIKAAPNLRSFAPMTERILFYTPQLCRTGLETVKLDLNNFTTLRAYFKQYQDALGLSKKRICEFVGQTADHCFRWDSSQWDLPTEETYNRLKELPLKDEFLRREYEDLRREYEDTRRVFNADSNTLDVIECPIINSTENTEHPTTKPLRIIERLITVSTNAGMTILDPMMGSGTTGVACVHTRRNFIGIEKDETYFNIASERIKNAQLPLL